VQGGTGQDLQRRQKVTERPGGLPQPGLGEGHAITGLFATLAVSKSCIDIMLNFAARNPIWVGGQVQGLGSQGLGCKHSAVSMRTTSAAAVLCLLEA